MLYEVIYKGAVIAEFNNDVITKKDFIEIDDSLFSIHKKIFVVGKDRIKLIVEPYTGR